MKALFSSALVVAAVALAGCTVHKSEAPGLTGPSDLALSLRVIALPDSINQDGGSQSSIQVTAIGPDGKPKSAVPLRMDMFVGGVGQDYGTLSARTIVTNSNGIANVVYTAPPSPTAGIFGTCKGLPGNCVDVVATASGTGFTAATPEGVTIRLVPTGVILPPAGAPTAAFSVSPQPAAANVSLVFDASASQVGNGASQITSYSWTFGDGTSGTGKTVTHSYAAQGSYSVMLTVTNDRTLSNSTTQAVSVGAGSLPTATFTFSPASPGVGEDVFFNASTSTAGTGHTIESYTWTFGDGATKTGVTTTHDYGIAGTYAVQLKVTDEAGQSTTSPAQTITIGSPPTPGSNFSFSPSNPGRFDEVVFDASSSTTAQGQTIVDVAWNFGDGTPVIHCPGDPSCITTNGNNRISTHTFQTATTFTVNLVVTDSAGRTSSSNKTVSVALAEPTVRITVSPSSPNPGTTVNFNSNGTTYFSGSNPPSFPVAFNWTFGDGTGSTLANPTKAGGYAAVGTYTVGLSVTDNKGRTGTNTATVTVVAVAPPAPPAAPVAAFTVSPPSPSLASPPVFFDASTTTTPSGAAITNLRWNFGDGTIISGAPGGAAPAPGGTFLAPRHTYGATGAYTVTLTVTDANGLQGSTTQTVTVSP